MNRELIEGQLQALERQRYVVEAEIRRNNFKTATAAELKKREQSEIVLTMQDLERKLENIGKQGR